MGETPASTPPSLHDRIMEDRGRGTEARGRGTEGPGAPDDKASKKPKGYRKARLVLGIVAGLAIVAGAGAYLYRNPIVGETIGQETRSGPGDAATDPFTAHASTAGSKACTVVYTTLGQVLTSGAQFMLQTETAKADAGAHGLQGLVGMTLPGGAGAAAGVVFAAPNGDKCEGDMVRVVPFAQSCQTAAGLLPKGSVAGSPLAGVAVYALPTGGQAMLLPAGDRCVAISVVRAEH